MLTQPVESQSALLVMDIQEPIVNMLGENTAVLDSIAKAITHARSNQIPVIYVVVTFRKGFPEVSLNNKSFSAIKGSNRNFDDASASKIPAMVAPSEGEVIVTKKRVSAFTGSDLEVVLRAGRIQHLILTGISTSGVVLSTVREAADKDYALTVLSDACADLDEEIHRVLTTKIFVRQANVLKVDEWISL